MTDPARPAPPSAGGLRVGVVAGLRAETRLLGRQANAAAAGGSADRAEELAYAAIARGAQALLSFGVAGGLAPALLPGALVIGTGVVWDEDKAPLPTDSAWRTALGQRLRPLGAVRGPVFCSGEAVAHAREKARLHRDTGCIAVDMESIGIARAAHAAGVPFAILRAVADTARRDLPAAAMAGMGPDGRMRPFAVVGALIGRPGELRPLLALAGETRAALDALRRVVRLLGPTLGL